MRTAAFCTLGCKVNQYETEHIKKSFEDAGYRICDFSEMADVYVVNTCSVTNIADRKSRQMLHRAAAKNPKALIVAVGCYVDTDAGKLCSDKDVDLMIPNSEKENITKIVEKHLVSHETIEPVGGEIDPVEESEPGRRTERERAYIKIEDGCNQFCSYCIIPYARGRVKSRQADEILDEVRGLAGAGYREVVVTGIHISSYAIDFKNEAFSGDDYGPFAGDRLIDIVEKISAVEGIERVRLGSMEPRIITEAFLKRLSAIPQIGPHFHLALQSGCNETLKRMNRHYSTELYKEKCELIRKYFDRPAICTDIIVGFPGETEEEFGKTMDFVKEISFADIHVFKYSKREGTKAATMPDQIPSHLQSARSQELIELSSGIRREYITGCMDKEMDVLIEEECILDKKSYMAGYSKEYIRCVLDRGNLEPGMRIKANTCRLLGRDTLFCEELH